MATLNIKMDPKSLECSLCLETFSDPRILPCGHTFCGMESPEQCLQQLDPEDTGFIKCPNCQTDHHVKAAEVPPDIKCKEMLESLHSKKQGKRMCRKHGEEIVMRCITDGEDICLSCVAVEHSGHKMEKVHKQEQKRLFDYWNKENAEFEDNQVKCRRRKKLLRKEAMYLDNQLRQENYLECQLGNMITRRDAITKKLACDDFNPEDEDIMALKEFMDQLKATSDYQQEASKDIRERCQQLTQLVDSRTMIFCQNINMNSVPAITRPMPIPRITPGPSNRPAYAAPTTTASEGGSTSRQDVGRKTLAEENVSCSSNILAFGDSGRNYILGLKDNKWEQWKGKRSDFKLGFGAICYKEKVYIIGGYQGSDKASPKMSIFDIGENKWTVGPQLNIPRFGPAACFVKSQRSIYICGGNESGSSIYALCALNSVEKLELDENGSPVGQWREITPMNEKRDGCAAVAVGSRLYVTGGRNEHYGNLSSMEILHTEAEHWIDGPRMKQYRAYHAVEYYTITLYAMGGCVDVCGVKSGIQPCEKLDLLSWTWTPIESMSVPRYLSGSVVANGKIYVVGGLTKGKKEDKKIVEIYDPLTNKWSRGPQLLKSLGGTKCVCW